MKLKKANEIYNRIKEEWIKRHGEEKLDPVKLNELKQALLIVPDEDGNKRVISMKTGKTHLVPIEHIILNGFKGTDLKNFPEERGG